MHDYWIIAALLTTAYLTGAIPFGLLIGRMRGVDIRTVGSRNIGATNVLRSVGTAWGVLTLALDILKGFAATVGLPLAAAAWSGQVAPAWLKLACGAAAVAGHNWPIYLRFRGGKGVAASVGVLLGIAPVPLACGAAAFALFLGALRYVSLGSIAGAITVAVAAWLRLGGDDPLTAAVLTGLSLMVIWRHRGNMQRLINGCENRIRFGGRT